MQGGLGRGMLKHVKLILLSRAMGQGGRSAIAMDDFRVTYSIEQILSLRRDT